MAISTQGRLNYSDLNSSYFIVNNLFKNFSSIFINTVEQVKEIYNTNKIIIILLYYFDDMTCDDLLCRVFQYFPSLVLMNLVQESLQISETLKSLQMVITFLALILKTSLKMSSQLSKLYSNGKNNFFLAQVSRRLEQMPVQENHENNS